jgi:hypothetical protein
MRHCRKLVSQLSEKLTWWGDDWDIPNMYMKLLFIVSLRVRERERQRELEKERRKERERERERDSKCT